jgi:hypothetical protein
VPFIKMKITMSPQLFQNLIAEFTAPLAGRALDGELAIELNSEQGPGSPVFEALFSACRAGVAADWMREREAVAFDTVG